MTPQPILNERERGERQSLDLINRWFSDPAFRDELREETARERRRVQHENDCAILANYRPENFDEEPGFVQVCRERVAAFKAMEGRHV